MLISGELFLATLVLLTVFLDTFNLIHWSSYEENITGTSDGCRE